MMESSATSHAYSPPHYCPSREVALRTPSVRLRVHAFLSSPQSTAVSTAVSLWVSRLLGPFAVAALAAAPPLPTLLFTHDAMTEHDLEDHPETPQRLVAILAAMNEQCPTVPRRHAPIGSPAELCLVHFVDYVNQSTAHCVPVAPVTLSPHARHLPEQASTTPRTPTHNVVPRKEMFARSLTFALTRIRSHVFAHTLAHSHVHTLTRSHAHKLTHSHTHTLTRSHAHTLTRAHAHTLTRPLQCFCSSRRPRARARRRS